MENAAKALTIAGAILISLMVISALVFAYRDIVGVKTQDADNQKTQEIIEFNKSYESYDKELYGAELLSLANKMWDYNKRIGGKDGYDLMELNVALKSNEIKKIKYFTELIDENEKIMKRYKSSNYLEALYDAEFTKVNDPSAKYQKDEILDKIGLKKSPSTLDTDYNKYEKYKELKTKKFKCTGTEYSKNGRIKSMTFQEQ